MPSIVGEDYTYTSSSDTLDDSDSDHCVSVPILSDSIDEEEECFTVSLSSSFYSGLLLFPRIATVCIEDDDRKLTKLHCISTLFRILNILATPVSYHWTPQDSLLSV